MSARDLRSGQLPPGAQEQLDHTLASYRAAIADGVELHVKILPGPGCAVAEALQGQTWAVDEVPALPIAGCTRAPCCGCCYCPVLAD